MDHHTITSPTKIHFFKPLVNPNFHNELIIPTTFFTKYLNNGQRNDPTAILRTSRGNKVWEVKVKGRKMVDGWKDFVKDHDLHHGDFLVFGHEGNFVFHVLIFDSTACEREYALIDLTGDDSACSVEELEKSDFEVCNTFKDDKNSNENNKRSNRKRKIEANGTYLSNGNPYFVATLKPAYVRSKTLRIPVDFSKQHGLSGKKYHSMTIRDQNQRLWNVEIREKMSQSNSFYFKNGWHDFCVGNHLKKGDSFMFELTETGDKPVLRFHWLEGSSMAKREICSIANTRSSTGLERSCKVKQETTSKTKNVSYKTGESYFCGIISARHLALNEMRFPREFARTNGINNRKRNQLINLRNKNGESWQVFLGKWKCDGQAYIGHGWRKFAMDNKLQVGDKFKLEAVKVKEDDMPAMNYYGLGGTTTIVGEMKSNPKSTALIVMESPSSQNLNDTIAPEMTSNPKPSNTNVPEMTSNPKPSNTNVPEMTFNPKRTATIMTEPTSSQKPTETIVREMTSNPKPTDTILPEMASNSKATSSTPTNTPCFCGTIKPCNLAPEGRMAIPEEFARSNGLVNKCCNMILKN